VTAPSPAYFQPYYTADIYAPQCDSPGVPLPDGDLSGKKLAEYLNQKVYPARNTECERLNRLDTWATGKQPQPKPLRRNTERAVLQQMARTPWIPLMISTFAQQMIVDGYHKVGETDNSPGWKTWLRNKMTSQQLSINRATMSFGYSYVRVTKSDTKDTQGKNIAVIRGMDPRDCFALYEDAFADEYPQYVLENLPGDAKKWRWWLPDGDFYELTLDGGQFEVGEKKSTEYGTPPFVRYVNQIDLRGRCWGDVEPIIDLAARIDKTAFDRLLVQHFNSFKVRWATGLEQPDTSEGVDEAKVRIQNEDILISSEAEAKFGTLQETSMAGFIDAYKADLEAFAAVMQLPPNLLGQVVNVAADALDGARRQTYQRLFEKQTVMGEAHAQVMRLAALIEGRDEDAEDFFARVHWQDVEVRSLAQFADAWGKIVMQLGVPKWAAWNKIPGVEQTEVEAWKQHALDDDPFSKYLRDVVGTNNTSLLWDTQKDEAVAAPVNTDVAEIGADTAVKTAQVGADAKAAAAKAAPSGGARGGPNNAANQRKTNNKTGNPKPTNPKTGK
jgi:hypothetical protein